VERVFCGDDSWDMVIQRGCVVYPEVVVEKRRVDDVRRALREGKEKYGI